MAILGKPVGVLTIAKTPQLYRVLAKIDEEIYNWTTKNVGYFDTARKGSSPLNAAPLRNLVAEVAVTLGKYAAGALNDIEKFFGKADVNILIDKAHTEGFPLETLC